MEISSEPIRWAVNTSSWRPSADQTEYLLSLLPDPQAESCRKFVQHEDVKRALASRLLQRCTIATVTGAPWDSIHINLTKGRKPYYPGPFFNDAWPNFNYSVSHEGDYVVIAADPHCIVGADLAAPLRLRAPPGRPINIANTIHSFKQQFAPHEWQQLQQLSPSPQQQEQAFQQLWSLKESYVKAVGLGLGFSPLSRAAFCVQASPAGGSRAVLQAKLHLDGAPTSEWRFNVQRLGCDHWASVARGPPSAVVDALGGFKATLRRPHLGGEELQAHLGSYSPCFSAVTIEELLPKEVVLQLMERS